MVRIRHFVDSSCSLPCFCKSFGIFNAVAVTCRAYLVKIHREDKLSGFIFLDAVNIFELNIISENRKSIVDLVISNAAYGIFCESFYYFATDRACGTVGDIEHALMNGLADSASGSVN